MFFLTIPLINYPAQKDKKKQKKKPIKKVLNSNPSTHIETSQQRVAFSNNRVQPRRARRRSGGVSDLRRSDLTTIDELGSNHNQNNNIAGRVSDLRRSDLTTIGELGSNLNQNNNSAGRRTQNLQLQLEDRIRRLRTEMSRGGFDRSRGFSDLSRGVSDLSRGVYDPSTIGEESNRYQSNNSASGRIQNLGMHTIVEEDMRRLRGNGNVLLDLNPATVREIMQLTQPQRDVTVIPIENDTNTVTTSNVTNLIKCCKRPSKEETCCFGLVFITALFIILMIVGLEKYKSRQAKVSISTNDSTSSNDLWDDYDSHYDIDPQKVR